MEFELGLFPFQEEFEIGALKGEQIFPLPRRGLSFSSGSVLIRGDELSFNVRLFSVVRLFMPILLIMIELSTDWTVYWIAYRE